MEQNNFEKQVREKLDELSLSPSDAVWPYVEKRIPHQRRHKRFVLLFGVLALLLTAGGGYWYLQENGKDKAIGNDLATTISSNSPEVIHKPIENNNHLKGQVSQNESKPDYPTPAATSEQAPVNKVDEKVDKQIPDKKEMKPANTVFNPQHVRSNNNYKQDVNLTTPKEDIVLPKPLNLVEKIKAEAFQTELAFNVSPVIFKSPFQSVTLKPDNTLDNKTSQTPDQSVSGNQDKPDDKVKSKWRVGFVLQGGKTLLEDNPLQMNKSADNYYASPNFSQSFLSQSRPVLPLKKKNAMAFTTGLSIEKNVTKRVSISTGIQYRYFSFITEVGDRNSDSALNFSANSYEHRYRNHFDFIEIPLSVKLRITRSTGFPVYWNGGITVSQLVGSNVLQLNTSQREYYVDNSFFRKTQAGLTTGFSAGIVNGKKVSINLGPYFYFQPTSIAKEGLYQGKNLFSFGLGTEILFNKK